jgi:PAS domain S-box-containing protein
VPVESGSDVSRLRAVLRDLVALSAIPTAWIGKEPGAVASGLADALVGLLQLDFVFVRLRDPGGEAAVEVTRGDRWKAFPEWLRRHLTTSGELPRREIVADVGASSEPCHGLALPIGVNGEAGLVAAGCRRNDFPTATDQFLLALAANHAATAFQSSHLIQERRRAEAALREARNELEVKVAVRTAELQRSEAYLAEAQRLAHTGSFVIDASTGELTHSSDEHSRLYGLDPDLGLPPLERVVGRIHAEDRVRWNETLRRGIRDRTAFEVEYRVVPAEGPVTHLRSTAHPVFDASGELKELVGTVVDVTERKQAEEDRRVQLWFFESLDRISDAMRRTGDLEDMLGAVLDVVLAVFDCDRAWLIHPCDPEVDSHRVRMERTRPEYIGAYGLHAEIPNDPEVARAVRELLASNHPVRFDPGSGHHSPSAQAERFGVRSMIAMAVYPKMDEPYMFGLHQCSHARIWTAPEERLFQEIGRRLADALDTLLIFRDLRESERSLERSKAQLAASRARIVTAADETRRRIQRDLHDGAQQQLVTLAMQVRTLESCVPPELTELRAELSRVVEGQASVLENLREIAQGIHPAALAKGGLGAALTTLARRSAVPVALELRIDRPLPAPVEVGAYYVVSEALTNTAKHAEASAARVTAEARAGILELSIHDDGRGGADAGLGSGLIGLADRVDALGGTIDVASPIGQGTSVHVTLPIQEPGSAFRRD